MPDVAKKTLYKFRNGILFLKTNCFWNVLSFFWKRYVNVYDWKYVEVKFLFEKEPKPICQNIFAKIE